MKKEKYLETVSHEKEVQKLSNQRIAKAREEYIKSSIPFDEDTELKITLNSGRVAFGKINSVDIWSGGDIYISSYKDSRDSDKVKYITKPALKVEKI